MSIDKERRESGSAEELVGKLFEAIHNAPADASIQVLTESVASGYLSTPIDLTKINDVLFTSESSDALKNLLAAVIRVQLERHVTRSELRNAQLREGEILLGHHMDARNAREGGVVPKQNATSSADGTDMTAEKLFDGIIGFQKAKAPIPKTEKAETSDDIRRKEFSAAYDRIFQAINAVRHEGLTVSQLLENVVANESDKGARSQTALLFTRHHIVSSLASALLVAAKEKITQMFVERYASVGAQESDRAQLIDMAQTIASRNRGKAVKLLVNYGIPLNECMNIIGAKNADNRVKSRVASSLNVSIESARESLKRDAVEWYAHVGPDMSMHAIVEHLAAEGFVHGGLGIDEVIAILTSNEAMTKLEDHVKYLASSILGISHEQGEPLLVGPKLDPQIADKIAQGKLLISKYFEQFKMQHPDDAVEKLPALTHFIAALKNAILVKAKSVYKNLLVEYDLPKERIPAETTQALNHLGERITQSLLHDGPESLPVLVWQVIDDLERAGLKKNDAIAIVSTVLVSAGHSECEEQDVRAMYYSHGEQILELDAFVQSNPLKESLTPPGDLSVSRCVKLPSTDGEVDTIF